MYTFVTSFHKQHEDVYARKMLESVVDKWKPTDFKLFVYLEGYEGASDNLPQADFIEYRHLEDIEARTAFIERNKDKNGRFGEAPYNYRMDAVRFCHKVYAMTDLFFELLDQQYTDWMVWLDADTITKKMFKAEDAAKIMLPEVDVVHLGRIDIDYSETGFVAFNLAMHNSCSLLVDLRGAYDTDEVFGYREWTDAFLFTRLLKIYEAHGMKARNLSEGVRGLSVFDQCMLDDHFTHNKGNLKFQAAEAKANTYAVSKDVTGPGRYKKLAALVRHYSENLETFTIVETGTWNGGRAIEMALTAFENVDAVHYRGFDLFEQATDETDKLELNVKQHNALQAVEERLTQFAERSEKAGKKFTFQLYAGDTKETMAKSRYDDVDFVFIDGGHSLDTVANDYSYVKDCPVVVFDDYYSVRDGNPDLPDEHTGINETFIAIEGKHKNVLPSDDPTAFGGIVHLAVCVKEGHKQIPQDLLRVPIIVKPKDSMPSQHIKDSIKANIPKIDNWDWVKGYKTTDQHVIIVSGGTIDFDKVREIKEAHNAKVWCVKHSLPRLMEEGIVPDYCMILDPRPIDGISTHGVKRKDLFQNISDDTTFLIASMTDTDVVDFVMSKTKNVKGFHAFTDAVRDQSINDKFVVDPTLGITPGSSLVSGGTASATRSLGLLELLGYRNIHLIGFDCSVPENVVEKDAKDEVGNSKYMHVEIGGDKFWTTGELLALAQDLEKLFEKPDFTLNVYFYGEGTLAKAVWNNSGYHKNLKTYEESLSE